MEETVYINANFIEQHTNYPELITALQEAFAEKSTLVPMRHHHDFPNAAANTDSTLLLMPAWNSSSNAGVKVVTVSPENAQFNLPSIQGIYIYLDVATGGLKAIMEAKSLTAKRTAVASALASSFLSRKDSDSLLMIGTGALSKNLIQAHASVRPIKQVYVWGRNYKKAQNICKELQNESFQIHAIQNIEEKVSEVAIVSCATLSETPLVLGKHLCKGQHIDLVGAYKVNMREADDETIQKSSVYIDTFEGGLKESGDIVIPLQSGILNTTDIKADLFGLCTENTYKRISDQEITLFKSVGHAMEDLAAANYYFKQYTNA